MALSQDHDCDLPFQTEGHPRPQFVAARITQSEVDPAAAQAFGRPAGVQGAFADQRDTTRQPWTTAAPPPQELAAAFSRPPESPEQLQRPPGRNGVRPAGQRGDDDFWPRGAMNDPWRDPHAAAVLGPPAVAHHGGDGEPPPPGARLSLAEVLFGGRVSNLALAALAAVALLIGGVGGLVGRLTAEVGTLLNDPGATLAQTQPAIQRPAGSHDALHTCPCCGLNSARERATAPWKVVAPRPASATRYNCPCS
jgi:hypothetical protein